MKKIVISGSASLQKEIKKWIKYFEDSDNIVLDYPQYISPEKFNNDYPNIHENFYKNIMDCDVLFIMNEDKNDKVGYIGAETFAELAFGLSQNLINNKNIELILLKMPCEEVQSYAEIKLWLELGWIKIFDL